jgi:hypothetical protein
MSTPELESLLRRPEQLVEQVAAALYDHPTGGISGQARRWAELYSEEARETWRAAARQALAALQPGARVFLPKKSSDVHHGERYFVLQAKVVETYSATEHESPGYKVAGNPMIGPPVTVYVEADPLADSPAEAPE